MKPIVFVGGARRDLSSFPQAAKTVAGFDLWMVQCGLEPRDWKPMATVGPGAFEIRIHVDGEWRVIYVAKFGNAVHVLHAFHKTTRRTRRQDIALAQQRYGEIEK